MNIAEKLSRGSRGFTLIEMMMVVIIILIMSSFVAANFRSGQSEFALLRANQQLISDIRKTQGYALNVQSDAYQYYILSISSSSSTYDVIGYRPSDNSSAILDSVILPNNILFHGSTFSPVIFSAPFARLVTYNNVSGKFEDAVTAISLPELVVSNNPSLSKQVYIFPSGLITN